jgi:hypothetical protein
MFSSVPRMIWFTLRNAHMGLTGNRFRSSFLFDHSVNFRRVYFPNLNTSKKKYFPNLNEARTSAAIEASSALLQSESNFLAASSNRSVTRTPPLPQHKSRTGTQQTLIGVILRDKHIESRSTIQRR